MADRKMLVFCSAAYGIDEKFNVVARDLIRAASLHNYDIVSGGTTKGTMGVLCEETKRLGVHHKGVIPRFMKQYANPLADEMHYTESMSARKDMMREGVDIALALPGGIGTMDELFETMALRKLGVFSGRIILVNYDGYYDTLLKFLGEMAQARMVDAESLAELEVVTTIDELEKIL